jgi:hypothetical protein
MKKIILLMLLIGLLPIVFLVIRSDHTYCVARGMYFYDITPTIQGIQTINVYSNVDKKVAGFTTLIRGNILKLGVVDNHILGYLSMKYTEADSLVGLTGIHDKEGFFIIDAQTREIASGLTGEEFNLLLKKNTGLSIEQVKFDFEPSLLSNIFLNFLFCRAGIISNKCDPKEAEIDWLF